MAYDFHGKWEKQAGHNAPLFAPSSDSEWRKQLSVSFAAKMWTRYVFKKLNIGVYTFSLSDASMRVHIIYFLTKIQNMFHKQKIQ